MSNLFSFAGNFASFVHIYNQLYNTEEFQDFHDYINEGNPKEVLSNLIRNYIFKQFDPIVGPYLENQELTQLMSNEKINHTDKCKIIAGKITNYALDHHPKFATHRAEQDMLDQFIMTKRQIIEETLESMNQMDNLKNVQTINDIYTIMVNDLAKGFVDLVDGVLRGIGVLQVNGVDILQLNEEKCLELVREYLKQFNENYEYQSEFCNDDFIDHDHDDDNDDSDGSDDSDEGDELPAPENKKRTFEKMNDGEEDKEKPVNKKNKK